VIIPKMLINAVANALAKHFKLEKIMSYVFEDNELDKEVKKLNKRVNILEHIILKKEK
jgi:long-subunit acyl-CoA synthetase (AMP-forming)